MALLGIDIGGTKTAVCVGETDGSLLATRRMPSRPGDALDDYFADLATLCREALAEAGRDAPTVDAVGVCAPGPLDTRRGILLAPPNNPGWRDVPIVSRVQEMLGRPVLLNNDANACALAEFYFGDQRGTPDLIYLTASTGMGAGIMVGSRLLQGVTDTGGEVGHQVLEPGGPVCACGLRGCWEVFVGGRSVAERLREKIRREGIVTKILEHAGGDLEKIDHKCFAAAAREGDPFALAEWDAFTERLAQGIGNLIMVFNPAYIFLGTMAIHEGALLLDPLLAKLPKYTWEWPRRACRVLPSSLGARIGELAGLAVARAG